VSARVPGEPASDRVLVVATRSPHKLGELRQLLHLPRTRLVSLDDVGVEDEAPEDGETFEANAVFKARYYAGLSGLPTLADDSGIEVDALGGLPGVRTRRYAGEQATDEDNNVKLLAALRGLPPERRGARYRCVLALVEPAAPDPSARGSADQSARRPVDPSARPEADRAERPAADLPARPATVRRGTFEGRIADGPRGTGGFGYDPIFEPGWEQPGGRTVGLYTAEEKNRVSHRAAAARAMRRVLVERGY
jgi:XTP/dITP diphosphohydrolase